MTKFLASGVMCAGLLMALPAPLSAHGGQYRGPEDIVPPHPGGGHGRTTGPRGPVTPNPSGPANPNPGGPPTPGPGGPHTGGPLGPGGARGPVTVGGGQLAFDLTRWEFWWEFNKDPFINLRASVHDAGVTTYGDGIYMGAGGVRTGGDTLKPTERQKVNEILPALAGALESTEQRDITSSCMVAMAKIGMNTEQVAILPLFKERLTSHDQEIRETAALAMGISQMTEAVADLVDLVGDTPAGRKLVGRREVDDRTRAFSAYALGLIGYATSNQDVKRQIFDALESVLDEPITNRNIPVSAINAIGLLRPDTADEKGRVLMADCLKALEEFYLRRLGAGQQQIQAHCPPAIAKLLRKGGDAEAAAEYKDLFLADLTGKGKVKRSSNQISQSAAIALGRLARPYDDKTSPDAKYSKALIDYSHQGKDQQTRYFSLMALGQIGGGANRTELLLALDGGSKALVKPWAALALGVHAFNEMKARGARAEVDMVIGRKLHKWLLAQKNPSTTAAIAVALGLARFEFAADDLRELLAKNKSQNDLAGYICIGLALMDDQRSIPDIQDLVETSLRRPERLQQAAIALGKLGNKDVAMNLQRMMTEDESQNLAKMAAIASALGYIGDRRTISPLVEVLFDQDLTAISRAFAAVALGGIADKEPLPWNSKIGTDMNYRAAVETLTNQVNGILDIL